jgi:hypothetical protein
MTSYEQFSQIGAAKLAESLDNGEMYLSLAANFIRLAATHIAEQQVEIERLKNANANYTS